MRVSADTQYASYEVLANGRNRATSGHCYSSLIKRSGYSMKSNQSAYDIACGLGLPAEYGQFLATRNGGTCRQDRSIRLRNGTEVLCDCLFGLDLQPGIDFQFWQRELADDLPKDSVAIGSDPGGAFFLLLKEREVWKVMYYDHAHRLSLSDDDGNTYECDISLRELLALVTEDFKAKR
jgi:hypothetical protein